MVYRKKGKKEAGCSRKITTRISDEEYKEWQKKAETLDITVSEYIRRCVRESSVNIFVKRYIDVNPVIEIAAEYGKIGSNINQIAHHLNAGLSWSRDLLSKMHRNLDEMEEVTKRLSEVVRKINGDHKTSGKQKFTL